MLRTRRNLGHNRYSNGCRLAGARFEGEGGDVMIALADRLDMWIPDLSG